MLPIVLYQAVNDWLRHTRWSACARKYDAAQSQIALAESDTAIGEIDNTSSNFEISVSDVLNPIKELLMHKKLYYDLHMSNDAVVGEFAEKEIG